MFNRSNIFRRAHELALWNRRTVNERCHPDFSLWLRMAWAEEKAGILPDYSPVCMVEREANAAQMAYNVAQNANKYDHEHVTWCRHRLNAAQSRLAELNAAPQFQLAAE